MVVSEERERNKRPALLLGKKKKKDLFIRIYCQRTISSPFQSELHPFSFPRQKWSCWKWRRVGRWWRLRQICYCSCMGQSCAPFYFCFLSHRKSGSHIVTRLLYTPSWNCFCFIIIITSGFFFFSFFLSSLFFFFSCRRYSLNPACCSSAESHKKTLDAKKGRRNPTRLGRQNIKNKRTNFRDWRRRESLSSFFSPRRVECEPRVFEALSVDCCYF